MNVISESCWICKSKLHYLIEKATLSIMTILVQVTYLTIQFSIIVLKKLK